MHAPCSTKLTLAAPYPHAVTLHRPGSTARTSDVAGAPLVLKKKLHSIHARPGHSSNTGASADTSLLGQAAAMMRRAQSTILSLRSSPHDSLIFNLAAPAVLALAADPLLAMVDTAIVGQLGSSELVRASMQTTDPQTLAVASRRRTGPVTFRPPPALSA